MINKNLYKEVYAEKILKRLKISKMYFKELVNAILYKMNLLLIRPFPRAFQKYGLKGNNLVGAEIGAFKGEHAKSILKRNSISKLYLIDPYLSYNQNDIENYSGRELSKAEKIARKKLNKFKNKIVWIRKISDQAVNYLPEGLDFVYIDGNHDYEHVKKDIEIYYPKLRKGGFLAGHDFDSLYPDQHGVIEAVLEFVNKYGLRLYNVDCDWWVIKK